MRATASCLGRHMPSSRISSECDEDLDALSDVVAGALLSLLRAGQIDQNKLSHYAVAQTLMCFLSFDPQLRIIEQSQFG